LLHVYRPALVHPFSFSCLPNQATSASCVKLILKTDTLHLAREGTKSSILHADRFTSQRDTVTGLNSSWSIDAAAAAAAAYVTGCSVSQLRLCIAFF